MGVIAEETILPTPSFQAAWDTIQVEPSLKDRLVAQSLLTLNLRQNYNFEEMPIHGIILLAGQPGTGKTTLARGLACKVAQALNGQKVVFIQIDAHALASSNLGKSQQEVTKLFTKTIPERAVDHTVIVLLDEVETLAADRQRMSLESNPIDVHRATDAALAGTDLLARNTRNTLIIATTNYLEAVDRAFVSRADLVESLGVPNERARAAIIRETLILFQKKWPEVSQLANNVNEFVDASEGLDGRALRKALISAAGSSIITAKNPGEMTSAQILAAIKRSANTLSLIEGQK